ncbi:MAG: hypothetical protein AAGF12_25025 [Myxococcota bacterium]
MKSARPRPVPDPESSGLIDLVAMMESVPAEKPHGIRSYGVEWSPLAPPTLAPPAQDRRFVELGLTALTAALLAAAATVGAMHWSSALVTAPSVTLSSGPKHLVAVEPTPASPGSAIAEHPREVEPTEVVEPSPPVAASSRATNPTRRARPTLRPATSSPADRERAPTPVASSGENTDSSLDALLERALGSGPGSGAGSAQAPEETAALPELPSRDAVLRSLRAKSSEVAACADGEDGIVNTWVSIDGRTGSVKRVFVTGNYAGSALGACVARVVRDASFPPFARSEFEVTFPYRL